MLKAGMDENTQDVGFDNRPGADRFPLSFHNEEFALSMPFRNLLSGVVALEKLNRAGRVHRGIGDIDRMVDQLPDHFRVGGAQAADAGWRIRVHPGKPLFALKRQAPSDLLSA
jgi:hypothetical protein